MVSRHHLLFWACNTAWLAPELLVSMGASPYLWIFHAKQRLLEQNYKSVWDPEKPVVLCLQYSVISTRITFLYGPQPLSVVFSCKTAPFEAELKLCMGSRPHLSVCACKSAWIAPELLVSMGSSPHLWFLHAKQRLLDQCTSLYWFQPSPVVLCMQNSDFRARITSLWGSKTSPVVFAFKTATSGPE